MGWIKDIGLQLLNDIIHIVNPTDLIQISCNRRIKHKETIKFSPHVINKLPRWSLDIDLKKDYKSEKFMYNYIELENNNLLSSYSKSNRICSQLAYFSLINGFLYKTINSLKPIRLTISKLHFHIVNENSVIKKHLILDIINCSWVHLCSISRLNEANSKAVPVNGCANGVNDKRAKDVNVLKELEENACIGCGIVRAIDIHNDKIYILTPETKFDVDRVNCIVKPNGISVPEDLFFRQELNERNLDAPYLSYNSYRT